MSAVDELYEVRVGDSLVRVAALHDCTPSELIKFNKLACRNIWPGQTLRIPPPPADPQPNAAVHGPPRPSELPTASASSRPPSLSSPPAPGVAVRASASSEELDAECLQRFLKLRVKQMTPADGSVSGTLLVTPNCLMFDPDVTHPLVVEFGPDPYGMVAPMDSILSAALFKDISGLTGEALPKSRASSDPQPIAVPDDPGASLRGSSGDANPISPKLLPIPEDELAAVSAEPGAPTLGRRHLSDSEPLKPKSSDSASDVFFDGADEMPVQVDVAKGSSCPVLPHPTNGQDPAPGVPRGTSESGGGTKFQRPRFSSLRQSLSKRASSFSTDVSSVAGSITTGVGAVASGVHTAGTTVATGVVSGTKTAAQGIQTGAKVAASGAQKAADGVVTGAKVAADGVVTGTKAAGAKAKAAATTVASVPANIVNMSSGLFSEDPGVLHYQDAWFGEEGSGAMKRQESLARLETLKAKSAARREEARFQFSCATGSEERPDLFKTVDELLPQTPTTPTQLPYYLCVKLRKRRQQHHNRRHHEKADLHEDVNFGNKRKSEFWFTVDRDKAEPLYQFLIQWKPSGGGAAGDASMESQMESGFLIIDGPEEEAEEAPPSADVPGSFLNKEWEIVTVEEVRRRLSLTLSPADLPIPAGASDSTVLLEPMTRQILEILPPRAESYPWQMIYCSTRDGFSLSTLYRRMREWGQELSPTLLLIKDTGGAVFGAIVSQPVTRSEHFYGTGDSCQLFHFVAAPADAEGGELRNFRWTGENNFFVKASRESLAVGSGGGSFGLWLDADLNHGRSRTCQTFNNPPLASSEDFIVATVEAFGFSDGF